MRSEYLDCSGLQLRSKIPYSVVPYQFTEVDPYRITEKLRIYRELLNCVTFFGSYGERVGSY